MKVLLLIATLLSSIAFAEDKVLEKKLILNGKDYTEARIQEEVLKFYQSILIPETNIKAERKAIVKKLNEENHNESVSDEVEVMSFAKTSAAYEVNGNIGTDLDCQTIYSVGDTIVLFEKQTDKRYENIAFGAQFFVEMARCMNEGEETSTEAKMKNDKVVVGISFSKFIKLSDKVDAL